MKALVRFAVSVLTLLATGALAQDVSLPKAERTVLDNGTVLVLVEKHDVPLIGLEAVVRGGAVMDPADKHGLANLLAGLLEKGAGERSAAEFAETAEAVGGQLGASAGLESINVSADFMAKDADLMIELVADMLQRPTLARAEFTKLRERRVNLIKAAKSSDPSQLIPTYANAFLFAEHPFGNPTGGSEASLANIGHEDLQSFYRSTFGADRLTIVAVGDFDTPSMHEKLTAAFAEWQPAGDEPPQLEAPPNAPGGRVYLIDKPGATQSYFRIGNVGVARDYPARAELELANTVFGGRFTSMLMTELRTKSGLTYTASSRLSRHSKPGSLFIASFTETGTTVEAIDTALRVLGQFRDEGLSDEALVSARNYIMGQFPPRLETASDLARQFAALELYGLGVEYIDAYGTALSAATIDSVKLAIDDVYPAREDLVFVIIGDAEKIRDQVAQYGELTEIPIDAPQFHP